VALPTTLKLVVREGVRALELASGGLGCSLVGLRAGFVTCSPSGSFMEGEKGSQGGGAWSIPPSETFYSQAMVLRECVFAEPL
jgi:hypothetical protein